MSVCRMFSWMLFAYGVIMTFAAWTGPEDMKLVTLLCGCIFFLAGLHFSNLDRIGELSERIEELEDDENGED